jgi:hypothetical protein
VRVQIPLSKVELLPNGRLELTVAADPDDYWRHIYRAAAEIQWDAERSILLSPRPELGPPSKHFSHVAQNASDELGYTIVTTAQTVWANVPDDERRLIEAYRPIVLSN